MAALSLKSGWLHKESPAMFGGWDKRWFVLDEEKLTYGKSEDDDQPKMLLLRTLGWCEAERAGSATFLLTMNDDSGRAPYKLKAKHRAEADEWTKEIRAAIEDHQLKEDERQDPRLATSRPGGMSMREIDGAVETPEPTDRARRSSLDLGFGARARRSSVTGFSDSDGDGLPPKCWAHQERDAKGGLRSEFKKVWVEISGSTLNTTRTGKQG
jgi:hypothetical protein